MVDQLHVLFVCSFEHATASVRAFCPKLGQNTRISTRIMRTLNSVVLREFDYESIIFLSLSDKYDLLQACCPQPSGV